MDNPGFWSELIRRKVVKVAVSYMAVAWLLIQIADIALESFGAPEYLMQAFMLFALLGVPIVLILSWALEVTPSGVRSDAAVGKSRLREAIAVLPFANMSSDDEIEHMADGLSDNIITECQRLLGIDVTSRNSTFVYKNQPVSITSVAQELNVAYILEGSIQKQSDSVRVTAQLINAADDSHLWADHFDRQLTDAFALQDDLTSAIVGGIKDKLSVDQQAVAEVEQPRAVIRLLNLPAPLLFAAIGVSVLALLLLGSMALPGNALQGLFPQLSFEIAGGLLLFVTVAGLFAYYLATRAQSTKVDLLTVLSEIDEYVAASHMPEAFDLAMSVADQLDSSVYDDAWWSRFSAHCRLEMRPADARVSWRPYNGRNVPWQEIGVFPEEGLRLPIGNLQFRLECLGYVTQEFAGANPSQMLHNPIFSNDLPEEALESRILTLSQHEEPGMVYASQGAILLGLTGLPLAGSPRVIKPFYLDRYPVSNQEYEAFVASGAYADDSTWANLDWPDDCNWREIVSTFVDRTEQAGPSGWELGRYPEGEADFPVTGVSWYEAAAYAAWAGKRLPTVYEWARAALPLDSGTTPIAVAIMNFSNFHGRGKHAKGEYPSMNALGCFDMFGNVREWSLNAVNEGRANLGGCDKDLPYFAVWLNEEDPLLRDADHGFRCCLGESSPEQLEPVQRIDRDYEGEEPASDEVYKALIQPLIPKQADVNAEMLHEETLDDGIRWQKYEIDSGYGERIPLVSLLPQSEHPVPSLVLFPGMGSFMGSSLDIDTKDLAARMDFIIKQLGYGLIMPAWWAAFERFDQGPFPAGEGVDTRAIWLGRMQRWVQEATQTVSFAEGNEYLDGDRVGYLGISYGATNTPPVLALEKRFKSAMMFSGNLMAFHMFSFADAKNFYPHIDIPVMFVNGRFDTIVSPTQSLLDKRLKWLGTPDEHKKQVIYDAGHWPFPQHLFKKDVADWLHTYL